MQFRLKEGIERLIMRSTSSLDRLQLGLGTSLIFFLIETYQLIFRQEKIPKTIGNNAN